MKKNLFELNQKYLLQLFSESDLKNFEKEFQKKSFDSKNEVFHFNDIYQKYVKKLHQKEYKDSDKELNKFLNKKSSNTKIVWGDCLTALKKMDSESIQLMVTSPPYYNARDYSQWKNIDEYLDDMRDIIKETWRVLDNHRVWVFNVGDIFDNPNTKTTSVWGKQRIPLGAYFIQIFEDIGFTFVDDFIWDKGKFKVRGKKMLIILIQCIIILSMNKNLFLYLINID